MRFRILRRGKARHHSIPEQSSAPAAPAPPRAAELDNPYGRVFGKARSREELRQNAQSTKK